MPPVNQTGAFSALAEVYDTAGLTGYTDSLAPHIINIAFDLDWTGRTLLDLGCATGSLCLFFAQRQMRTYGVDISLPMIQRANAKSAEYNASAEFFNADIRAYKHPVSIDIVTCLGGTLNYMPSLRDLETVLRTIFATLEPGKLFVFDMRTIQGLAQFNGKDRIMFDNGTDATIVTHDEFNFETLALTRHYTVLRYDVPKGGWIRSEEVHTLRGYPATAVLRLANQIGFNMVRTMTLDFENAEGRTDVDELLFVAQKPAE
jgi:SAM-dependent methyltransferase